MNILVQIAKEEPKAYCVSPETIQEAINRGITKADICLAIVDIESENHEGFYLEDSRLCCFIANKYEKET